MIDLTAILTGIINFALSIEWTRTLIAYSLLGSVVFWLLWINLNVLHNRMKQRTGWRKWLIAIPFWITAPFALILDALVNKVVGTTIFTEWGCEWTFSNRLTRYISRRSCNKAKAVDYGYRTPIAVWFATNLVEPAQPGHIGLVEYGYPPSKDLVAKIMSWKWVKKLLP